MKKVLCVIAVIFLVGCGDGKRTLGSEAYIGEVQGCRVSEVLTGGLYPAFVTRCKDVVTNTSYNYDGFHKRAHASISIKTTTESELRDLIYKEEVERQKQVALNKLSDEEKKLLGLQ